MKLLKATALIEKTARRMNDICQHTVFDEFAIVEQTSHHLYLHWYKGSRRAEYIRSFKADTATLKKESRSRFINRYDIGGYEFVFDGVGTQAESFLVVGENLYLILTNTIGSMADIEGNPLWLKAQVAFVEMSEQFQFDPLEIAPDVSKVEIT